MDWSIRKKVLSLRKRIFEFLQKEKEYNLELEKVKESENNYEIELIDEIIITINEIDDIWDIVEENFQDTNEMLYYDFMELTSLKDEILDNALELKNEIVEKLYDNNNKLKNSHENINTDIEVENNIILLKGLIDALKSASSSLKNILNEYKDINFINIKSLIKNTYELYKKYDEIYDYNRFDSEYDLDDNYIDEDIDFDTDFGDDNEDLDTKSFKVTSMPNYDVSLTDNIYIIIFNEINLEQRLLIGIMLSDFYEYHKINQNMYSKEEDKDKLELIEKLENSNLDDMVNEFLQDANLGMFILDNYLYYNENFSSNEKLENRAAIKSINKLNILKEYNKFITDNLVDDTLFNTFINTINDYIRIFNENLISHYIYISNGDSLECLFKYFKSDFIPNEIEELLPHQLKEFKIKKLKELQLKFMLTDYLTKQIKSDDENVKKLLELSTEEIYNIFFKNEVILKNLLNDHIKNEFEPLDIDLTKEQKQKIYKLNKLTILDN